MKTVKPFLKPPVEMVRGMVVYRIICPCWSAYYVGQTSRHLEARFREHIKNAMPAKRHLRNCRTSATPDNVELVESTSRGEIFLETLEVLWIKELEPSINTRDEYKRRTLTIKFLSVPLITNHACISSFLDFILNDISRDKITYSYIYIQSSHIKVEKKNMSAKM